MANTQALRKRFGLYYTPPDLVDLLVGNVLADIDADGHFDDWPRGRAIRVLDPACGDGRLLEELRVKLHLRGLRTEMVGCDIDADALANITHPNVHTIHGNALDHDWSGERFDIVIGNPPYLSQMASITSRGGSSKYGGGPYADAAAEFLALAIELADPEGGRVALVLPQSILASRDAGPIRARVDELADHAWSWWVPEQQLFDANVHVCVLGFRRPSTGPTAPLAWTKTVTDELGIPELDPTALATDGTIGDRAELNANFRDEYYALVPAVSDDASGPPLITSGLIDPGTCAWGSKHVKFAKQRFEHPRVELSKLEGRFPEWARRKLVPKVLVANQTRLVEAVADPDGAWLPGVPVTTVIPIDADGNPSGDVKTIRRIEAIYTSPIASAMCWHNGGGTGLSTQIVRLTPAVLGDVPWPAGPLDDAVAALAAGDVEGCGLAVMAAYGLSADDGAALFNWWRAALPGA